MFRAINYRFLDVFNAIGKLRDFSLNLHIDESVEPVSQPARRIPYPMHGRVAKELQCLEEQGIIEDAKGPVPWVSLLVIVPKPKDPENVRICVDMHCPNTAIRREKHVTPTVNDFIQALNGSTVFSKVDLNSAYHQIELAENCRYITTFSSHIGLKSYTRLNYGTNSAAEIFDNIIRHIVSDIPGVKDNADDLIIFGKDTASHDTALGALLSHLKEKGLTLNPKKCVFDKNSIEVFGYTFSEKGISVSPTKVTDIKQATPPITATEVRSFLGLTNSYCSRFINNYTTLTAPLFELTKKHNRFEWTDRCQQAFDQIKEALSSDTVMGYFDLNNETEIIVDASHVGLGAILVQCSPGQLDNRIIAYASRALTKTEKRYSQLEKECLSITFGIEHFKFHVYGLNFTLVTDHRPLEYLFNNPRAKPSMHVE